MSTFNTNALLARFESKPCVVATGMDALIASSLNAVISHPRSEELMNAQASAGDGFWFASDDWRAVYRPYVVSGGVLQIPVKGVLLNDFSFAFGAYATGYDYIWRAFDRGMSDPEVLGIALVINSPGGIVAGNFDLVDRMFAMRGTKPIRAFVNENAYSAAYSIASVADQISVSRTGGVGSIGVVMFHTDYSGMMAKDGVKRTYVFAGAHKVDGNGTEALPDAVKSRWQEQINETYEVFVSTVARNRGLDEQAIRETEALTFTANQAIANKLADTIGSFDDQLAAFAVEMSTNEGEVVMADQVNAATDQVAIDKARAEGQTTGASAERARISAIRGSDEAKGRSAAAETIAMETSMNVEDAKAFLGKLPLEATATKLDANAVKGNAGVGNRFDAAMNSTQNPEIAAGGDDEKEVEVSASDRILASYFGAPKA